MSGGGDFSLSFGDDVGPGDGGGGGGDSLQFFSDSAADGSADAGWGQPAVGAAQQPQGYFGGPDPLPSYGQMAPPSGNIGSSERSLGGFGASSFDDEPPLLEELGINFDHIKSKTLSALDPFRKTDGSIIHETDLAGPVLFCLLFGSTLLATGKIHFGYIYGVAVVGCVGLYAVLTLMSNTDISIGHVASVLGYCLLPMVALSSIGILLSLNGIVGVVLALTSILWCSYSACKMFAAGYNMEAQRLLIAYPCFLLYGVFALLTVF